MKSTRQCPLARIALSAAFGFAALFTVPQLASAEDEIVVTGKKDDIFGWTSVYSLADYGLVDTYALMNFDGILDGGGGGGFDLSLPPDCEVELCWEVVEVEPDENFDDEVVAFLDAANSLTEEQADQVTPYLIMAGAELDFQLYFAELGGTPDLALYESLLQSAVDMTTQFGIQNGATMQ